jgi:nicotinamidase-related amidase
MSTASQTLRDITGLGYSTVSLKDSALVMVDCQNTYRRGIMQLTNVEPAIKEAQKLLDMAPYDVTAEIGQISAEVAPKNGEAVITKNYPNSFIATPLEAQLKALGTENVVLAGFMTHMCINSTARGAFNLGFKPTVIASACATRSLVGANGKIVDAQTMHEAALAAIRDLFAVVLDDVASLKV